eukprot:TRINITY_DN11072_c0_g1_i4.p1 TRINITY_DN11072_c0_g1~~TRINITY_DN11072_c0_g1_i4.p1  ORF type:complete len:126 (+),score=32.29 TRINITY_DN11072_c0_g1_i4:51-428(+)
MTDYVGFGVLLCFFFFFKQKTAYEMLRSLVGSEMCIRDRSTGSLYFIARLPLHTSSNEAYHRRRGDPTQPGGRVLRKQAGHCGLLLLSLHCGPVMGAYVLLVQQHEEEVQERRRGCTYLRQYCCY